MSYEELLKEAEKMTFDKLTEFIARVRERYPDYSELKMRNNIPKEEYLKGDLAELGYMCGIHAGVLISLAAFHATSNKYAYSCNQAGTVRNIWYKAIFNE
jgi:hypothetical protein